MLGYVIVLCKKEGFLLFKFVFVDFHLLLVPIHQAFQGLFTLPTTSVQFLSNLSFGITQFLNALWVILFFVSGVFSTLVFLHKVIVVFFRLFQMVTKTFGSFPISPTNLFCWSIAALCHSVCSLCSFFIHCFSTECSSFNSRSHSAFFSLNYSWWP